jgi:hypothetical protein
MRLLAIDIIGIIRELVKWALKEIVLLLGVTLFGLSAPVLFTVGAEVLVWQNPSDLSWTVAYFLLGPLACAVWMVFICHWHSVRQWQREGKNLGIMGSNWREANGGMVRTVGKSMLFMVGGFLGSALAEGTFLIVAYYAFPHERTRGRMMLYFAIAPFAVFAPCLIVLLSRAMQRPDGLRVSCSLGGIRWQQ